MATKNVAHRGQRTDSCQSRSSLAIEEASALRLPFDLDKWVFARDRKRVRGCVRFRDSIFLERTVQAGICPERAR